MIDTPVRQYPEAFGIGALFWKTPIAYVVARASDMTMMLFNPAATELLGWAPADVLEQNVTMLMPDEFISLHQTGVDRWQSTGFQHFVDQATPLRVTAKCKDREAIPVTLTLFKLGPVPPNVESYVVATIQPDTGIVPVAAAPAPPAIPERVKVESILHRIPPFDSTIAIKLMALAWIFWYLPADIPIAQTITQSGLPIHFWAGALALLALANVAMIVQRRVWFCRIFSLLMVFWWLFLGGTIYATDNSLPLAIYFGANAFGSALTFITHCGPPPRKG